MAKNKADAQTQETQEAQDAQAMQEILNEMPQIQSGVYVDVKGLEPQNLQAVFDVQKAAMDIDPEKYAQDIQAVREGRRDGSNIPNAFETYSGNDPETIEMRTMLVQVMIGYMQQPIETLMGNASASDKASEVLVNLQMERTVSIIAEMVENGADPEQVNDPKKWTDEQKTFARNILARERLARMEAYYTSNHWQAVSFLHKQERTFDGEILPGEHLYTAAANLFFALHYEDIRPQDEQALTDEQLNEIKKIHDDLDTFATLHAAGGKDPIEAEIFLHFVEKYTGQTADADEKRELPQLKNKEISAVQYMIDRFNTLGLWGLKKPNRRATPITTGEYKGQLQFYMGETKNDVAGIVYYINFDGLDALEKESLEQGIKFRLPKSLTMYDKAVYIAVCTLFMVQGEAMTIRQIYNQMGYDGRPNGRQIKEINNSLTKMGAIRIYLDNSIEISTYNYPLFKCGDEPLLSFSRKTFIIDGNETEGIILHEYPNPLNPDDKSDKVFLPPLMLFAQAHKQITTRRRELLQIPINKSESVRRIDDYLFTLIARWRNMVKAGDKPNCKVTYTKICQRCEIVDSKDGKAATETERKKVQRTKATINALLDFYTQKGGSTPGKGFIKGYTKSRDTITIILPDKQEID